MDECFISMPEKRTHPFWLWTGSRGRNNLLRECPRSTTRQIGWWDQREFSTRIALPLPRLSRFMIFLQHVLRDGSQLRSSSKAGLALSPDETWIAYSESDTRGSDLMLADGVQ